MEIQDFFYRLSFSRGKVYFLSRWLIILLFAIGLFTNLWVTIKVLFPPYIYLKDFLQEYLLARAILKGIDPYTPSPVLSQLIIGPLPVYIWPHPTPHPPPVALLSLPLGLLPYQISVIIWYILDIACITTSTILLIPMIFTKPNKIHYIFVPILLLFWGPIKDELAYGQLMSIILLLLVLTLSSMIKGRESLAGLFLGIALAIKLIAWPILLYFFFMRWIKVFIISIFVFVSFNIFAGFIMGFDQLWIYYSQVAREVAYYYRSYEGNYSLWSIGYHLFEGMQPPENFKIHAPPLFTMPIIAPYVSIVIVMIFIFFTLWKSLNLHDFRGAYGIMICASIMLSPIAWNFYLVLALIPIALILKHFVVGSFDKKAILVLIIIGLLLLLDPSIGKLFWNISDADLLSLNEPRISFLSSLSTYIPTIALLGIIWIIPRSNNKKK